jgi:hypothetical protein
VDVVREATQETRVGHFEDVRSLPLDYGLGGMFEDRATTACQLRFEIAVVVVVVVVVEAGERYDRKEGC